MQQPNNKRHSLRLHALARDKWHRHRQHLTPPRAAAAVAAPVAVAATATATATATITTTTTTTTSTTTTTTTTTTTETTPWALSSGCAPHHFFASFACHRAKSVSRGGSGCQYLLRRNHLARLDVGELAAFRRGSLVRVAERPPGLQRPIPAARTGQSVTAINKGDLRF